MTEEKVLTKDQILKAKDLPTEKVEVPEWGGVVFVRTLTGKERDELEASIITGPGQRDLTNIRAKLLALSVVNDKGERIFSSKDVPQLAEKSSRVMDRLFAVAQRLSGLTAKDMEELTKNLPKDQSESSISG